MPAKNGNGPNAAYQTDDGTMRFRKGNKGGPGRKKGQRRLLDELWKALARQAPGDEIEAAVKALGLPASAQDALMASPDRLTALAEIMVVQALIGQRREDLLARIEPAPKAVELSGPNKGPIRTASAMLTAQTKPETAEAAYFEKLVGGGDDGTNDADGT